MHQEGLLDALGRDGWELVGFDASGTAFFKRAIEESQKQLAKPRRRSK
jgi:hypothetical protein